MKLVFAIKRLENMAGGAERVILQVIDGLRRTYGHDITLVTFDRVGATSFYPLPEGITWVQLGVGDSARRSGFTDTVRRMVALRRIIKDSHADWVIPFQHSMFVPMVLAMTGLHIPIIASEHIVPDHYAKHPLEYALLVLTGLRCRKVTVLSDAIIKMYPSCLWSRMVAMPNPVDTSAQPADVVAGGMRKRLLSVGRMDPQKDQATLIAAFAQIASTYPDWDLKIVGEGRLRPDLGQQIKDLGLGDRISLPGLSRAIMAEYQQAQAFALASVYEAFGLATAEAMSAGLPVVGFADCPGTNELIKDDENGLLVRVAEREARATALSKVLARVMGDAALRLRLGQNGRVSMQQFSRDAVIAKWQALLEGK